MNESQPSRSLSEEEFDYRPYLNFLRRWWRLIALCGILGVLAGFTLTMLSPRSYQATANLVVVRSAGDFPFFRQQDRSVSDMIPAAP